MQYTRLAFLVLLSVALPSVDSFGSDLRTNAIIMKDAPAYVTASRLDTIVDHIETLLEWDIRRITVVWQKNEQTFEDLHHCGPNVTAFSFKKQNVIHLGPKVNDENFDGVLGHELAHIIIYQKYHNGIPPWLEEGLANHLSHRGKVDYKWLASQPAPSDVRNLLHPFAGTVDDIRYHYMASQALIEMIASRCDLGTLIQLSIKRNFEDKLDTYCHIKDINTDYRAWLKKNS